MRVMLSTRTRVNRGTSASGPGGVGLAFEYVQQVTRAMILNG
jgi:hypothetical protein